ncbi:uncharacterized protein LOC132591369 [Zootoca vivipara]|uniref:uncharacterized protein LOC132591369 n=1 Tax=Zootoca vivipara TaxID=8524 RepID=UPI00293BE5E7|nr:uncharacterized protein LOC132591369 [Zootoca vivipara]
MSLGQSVKFSCSKSSGGSWSNFYWYQQKPGQAPRFVLYHISDRGEGIPDWFTGSVSGNTGYLTISNTQAEDEAVYYCCAWERTGSDKFHGGKQVDKETLAEPMSVQPICVKETIGISGGFQRGGRRSQLDLFLKGSHTLKSLTMAWPLLFLSLLSYCTGVTSQPSLTQPASQSVSLGQTATLSCSRNGGSRWDDIHWYQQKPGQPPRFLWYGSSTRGEGVPVRFTGSRSGTLTISNIEAADEAVYFCCDYEGGSSTFHSGIIK